MVISTTILVIIPLKMIGNNTKQQFDLSGKIFWSFKQVIVDLIYDYI